MKNQATGYGLSTAVLCLFCVIALAQSPLPSGNPEASFKAAFNKYQEAINGKENDRLRASLTAAEYMQAKNEGISMKRSFPKDYFENTFVQVFASIDLNQAKTLRAAENGSPGVLISLFPKSSKFNPFEPGAEAMVACLISR